MGLNLGTALGLNFCHFGDRFEQGLGASIFAILGRNLWARALVDNFRHFGAKCGQGSGPQFFAILGLNLGRALGLNSILAILGLNLRFKAILRFSGV